jgi:hypothetical protein
MGALLFAIGIFASSSFALSSVAAVSNATAAPMLQEPEPEEKGMASAAGVHVTVKADSWAGWPRELTEVIPLLVSVENKSGHPVRLRYKEFQLAPPTGAARAALPVFDIRGRETVGTTGVLSGPYPYILDGFLVAPYLAPLYPHLHPFRGPFAFDPLFYSTYYPAFRSIPLPTGDMVLKALPEGVLEPGGRITGFLYFRGDDVEGDRATFQMDVVDARTGRTVGTARVPLEID